MRCDQRGAGVYTSTVDAAWDTYIDKAVALNHAYQYATDAIAGNPTIDGAGYILGVAGGQGNNNGIAALTFGQNQENENNPPTQDAEEQNRHVCGACEGTKKIWVARMMAVVSSSTGAYGGTYPTGDCLHIDCPCTTYEDVVDQVSQSNVKFQIR